MKLFLHLAAKSWSRAVRQPCGSRECREYTGHPFFQMGDGRQTDEEQSQTTEGPRRRVESLRGGWASGREETLPRTDLHEGARPAEMGRGASPAKRRACPSAQLRQVGRFGWSRIHQATSSLQLVDFMSCGWFLQAPPARGPCRMQEALPSPATEELSVPEPDGAFGFLISHLICPHPQTYSI